MRTKITILLLYEKLYRIINVCRSLVEEYSTRSEQFVVRFYL